MSSRMKFIDSLADTDYGLIICGKTGVLKGIFIPDGQDEDAVPEPVAKICKDYFNIDPNEDITVH